MKELFSGHKRNLPCYCGSGKKYKVCHYAIDANANEVEKEAIRKQQEEEKKSLLNKIITGNKKEIKIVGGEK